MGLGEPPNVLLRLVNAHSLRALLGYGLGQTNARASVSADFCFLYNQARNSITIALQVQNTRKIAQYKKDKS